MTTGYHWKQVDAGVMLPVEQRPGIAWSRDYADAREAMRNRPSFGRWLLVRNRDGAIADAESVAAYGDALDTGRATARDIIWLNETYDLED